MRWINRIFNIKKYNSTAYHPQSNGAIERMHSTLTEYLKQYLEGRCDWDKWLPTWQLAYNCAEHEAHNQSPHELVYGRKARIPSSFPVGEELVTYDEYLAGVSQSLEQLQTLAALNTIQAKYRSKYYYDIKLNTKHFRKGELVHCLKEPKTGKFSNECHGPFEITHVDYNSHNVHLRHGSKIIVTHVDKIKRAFEI